MELLALIELFDICENMSMAGFCACCFSLESCSMSAHLLSDGENVSWPMFMAVSLMMRSMFSRSPVILIFSKLSLVFLGRPRFFFGKPSHVSSLTGAGFCGRRGTEMLTFSSPSPRTFFGRPRFFFIGMPICERYVRCGHSSTLTVVLIPKANARFEQT